VEHATGKVRPKPWLRRGGGGGGGMGRAPSPRPVRRSYDYDRERCAYCGERGHPSYDCPRERRGRRRCVVCRTVVDVDDDDRVTTCLENPQVSGKLIAVGEVSGKVLLGKTIYS